MQGLPKDIVWLILRDVIAHTYVGISRDRPITISAADFFETGLLFPSTGIVAQWLCHLQQVCRLFQTVLRSKCKWKYLSSARSARSGKPRSAGFIFIRGSFEGVYRSAIFVPR
jgi:hypothetical protein